MIGILINLIMTQMSTDKGFETTSRDIAAVRIADMTYVVLPNLFDKRIFSSRVFTADCNLSAQI